MFSKNEDPKSGDREMGSSREANERTSEFTGIFRLTSDKIKFG